MNRQLTCEASISCYDNSSLTQKEIIRLVKNATNGYIEFYWNNRHNRVVTFFFCDKQQGRDIYMWGAA